MFYFYCCYFRLEICAKAYLRVKFYFFRRIKRRPTTERYNIAAHTPLATELQARRNRAEKQEDGLEGPARRLAVPQTADRPSNDAATKSVTATAAMVTFRGETPATQFSSLHTLSGYLDVGCNALFQSQKDWLKVASGKLVAGEQVHE